MPLLTVNGNSYSLRSSDFERQELINFYMEMDETQRGKVPAALYGTPGLELMATLPGHNGIRGLYAITPTRLLAVRGNLVYEITDNFNTVLLRGPLGTESGPVTFADNGIHVVLADGVSMYLFTLATSAFATLGDADAPHATHVAFLDGYILANRPQTGRFQISGLYDATAWDALDFATVEGAPDNLVAIIADHRELFCFGETTTEVFFNSGNADFPFERIQGAFIEQGCVAPYSVAKMDNSVFWLGQDQRGQGIVWRMAGYQPQRISTYAVEYALSTYTTIADACSWTYQSAGHTFYVLCFPSGNATWVFDAATSSWHRRAFLDAFGDQVQHRAETHAECFGRHIVGDRADGRLYALDDTVYTDDGGPIASDWILPSIVAHDLRTRVFHHAIELDFEAGVGLGGSATGDALDPLVSLRWADDGGHIWGTERFRAMGRLGNYAHRARWERLGQSRNRNYWVRITSPVKRAILGMHLHATPGAH